MVENHRKVSYTGMYNLVHVFSNILRNMTYKVGLQFSYLIDFYIEKRPKIVPLCNNGLID